jgi:hypothetical protein
VSLAAQEAAGAMLRSSTTGVSVNHNSAPSSIALYRGDLIETTKEGVARLEITGSSVDVAPETVTHFEGDEMVLDHGALSVDTSRGLRVRVNCITVTPVNDAMQTHYEVSDYNGRVTVSSMTHDTYIDERSKNEKQEKPVRQTDSSHRSIVREGEQKSREEKCGAGYVNGATEAAKGPLLDSVWARAIGAGGVAALTCWALCFQNSNPISPSNPSKQTQQPLSPRP